MFNNQILNYQKGNCDAWVRLKCDTFVYRQLYLVLLGLTWMEIQLKSENIQKSIRHRLRLHVIPSILFGELKWVCLKWTRNTSIYVLFQESMKFATWGAVLEVVFAPKWETKLHFRFGIIDFFIDHFVLDFGHVRRHGAGRDLPEVT